MAESKISIKYPIIQKASISANSSASLNFNSYSAIKLLILNDYQQSNIYIVRRENASTIYIYPISSTSHWTVSSISNGVSIKSNTSTGGDALLMDF